VLKEWGPVEIGFETSGGRLLSHETNVGILPRPTAREVEAEVGPGRKRIQSIRRTAIDSVNEGLQMCRKTFLSRFCGALPRALAEVLLHVDRRAGSPQPHTQVPWSGTGGIENEHSSRGRSTTLLQVQCSYGCT